MIFIFMCFDELLNLLRHRNPIIAFELSIFEAMNSETGFMYGRTRVLCLLLELMFSML